MNKQNYTLIENYMFSCMEDSAHGKDHIYRVLYQALRIAKTEEKETEKKETKTEKTSE